MCSILCNNAYSMWSLQVIFLIIYSQTPTRIVNKTVKSGRLDLRHAVLCVCALWDIYIHSMPTVIEFVKLLHMVPLYLDTFCRSIEYMLCTCHHRIHEFDYFYIADCKSSFSRNQCAYIAVYTAWCHYMYTATDAADDDSVMSAHTILIF